jgi:hypothetical protein
LQALEAIAAKELQSGVADGLPVSQIIRKFVFAGPA